MTNPSERSELLKRLEEIEANVNNEASTWTEVYATIKDEDFVWLLQTLRKVLSDYNREVEVNAVLEEALEFYTQFYHSNAKEALSQAVKIRARSAERSEVSDR